jgi:hypothetical protein
MHDGTLKVTPITAAQPTPVAKFTITASVAGFPVTVEVEGKADGLRAMIDRLKAIGAEPPNQTANLQFGEPAKKSAPLCPFRNSPMKPSRKPGKFYCAKRADDGEYCRETA